MNRKNCLAVFFAVVFFGTTPVFGQRADSLYEKLDATGPQIMMSSNGGLGLGWFYRHRLESNPSLYWFLDFSVSDVKDDEEFEYFNPYTGQGFVPGKLNRFFAVPLFAGIEYRLWREDIQDNFRPYLMAAAGPAIVYSAPYIEEEATLQREVDFLTALGRGKAYYTAGGYLGAGAFFGDLNKPIGVSARYVFLPVFEGIASRGGYGTEIKKYSFGGFNIVVSLGWTF